MFANGALADYEEGVTVNELVPLVNKSRPTVYYAMETLCRVGCFTKTKRGRENVYHEGKNISNLLDSRFDTLDYGKMVNDSKILLDNYLDESEIRDVYYNNIVFDPIDGEKHSLFEGPV